MWTFTSHWATSEDDNLMIFSYFAQKTGFEIYANCLRWRQFARNVKSCFLGKIRKIFQYVLKTLHRMISVKWQQSYCFWQIFYSRTATLRRLDTPARFSAIFYKGDNFCGFLFAFLHIKILLKMGLPYHKIICSLFGKGLQTAHCLCFFDSIVVSVYLSLWCWGLDGILISVHLYSSFPFFFLRKWTLSFHVGIFAHVSKCGFFLVRTVTSSFPGRRLIRVILSLTGYPESKQNTWHKTYPQLFPLFIPNLIPVNLNLNGYQHSLLINFFLFLILVFPCSKCGCINFEFIQFTPGTRKAVQFFYCRLEV